MGIFIFVGSHWSIIGVLKGEDENFDYCDGQLEYGTGFIGWTFRDEELHWRGLFWWPGDLEK